MTLCVVVSERMHRLGEPGVSHLVRRARLLLQNMIACRYTLFLFGFRISFYYIWSKSLEVMNGERIYLCLPHTWSPYSHSPTSRYYPIRQHQWTLWQISTSAHHSSATSNSVSPTSNYKQLLMGANRIDTQLCTSRIRDSLFLQSSFNRFCMVW